MTAPGLRQSLRPLLVLLIFPAIASTIFAQDEPEPEATEEVSNDDKQPLRFLDLPTRMADGRPLKAMTVFYDQLISLIPKNYAPVEIKRLGNAINKQLNAQGPDESNRLRSSFYDVRLVNDALICQRDRSEIVIETDQSGIVRRSLGKVNIAIASKGNVLPRLESSIDGDLIAVLPEDAAQTGLSTINFSWSARGEPVGEFRDFKLNIPRTPETRIVLSAPLDYVVTSIGDGVLRRRASIPQGAETRSQQVQWFELEAGGLSKIHLRTFRIPDSLETKFLTVHQSFLQYEIDAVGIRWSQLMTVQARGGTQLPPLRISDGVVTSVEIDDLTWKFRTQPDGQQGSRISFDKPLGGSPSETRVIPLLVRGILPLELKNGWADLPRIDWPGVQVFQTQVTDQARLGVRDPISVVTWELPEGWSKRPSENGTLSAEGPSLEMAMSGNKRPKLWSRVRLTQLPSVVAAKTLVQLNVAASRVAARARIIVETDPNRIVPIPLMLQTGWKDVVITIPNSRRVIERFQRNQTVSIYPEPEDILDGELVIEVSGQRDLTLTNDSIVPKTWLARIASVRGDFVCAIVPPAELNWTGETAMQHERVSIGDLSPPELEFFGTLPDETLYFRPAFEQSPELSLQEPDVSTDVRTSLRLDRDGNDVVESLTIEAKSASQRIANQFASDALPLYRWSLRGEADQIPINLPERVVVPTEGGKFTIDLGDRNLRGKRLVGRRQYRLTSEPLNVALPVIFGATQTGEVLLGPGLSLQHRSDTVDLVPPDRSAISTSDTSAVELKNTIRLRYDPISDPSITIVGSDDKSALSIVWEQNVSITASSRGSDTIEAFFRVSSAKPIVINYEPDLQLAALYLNGESIDVADVQQRPIVLPSSDATSTVELLWTRNKLEPSWFRRLRIPRIEMSGVSVKSSYRLSASPDTFAPSTLFRATSDEPSAFAKARLRQPSDAVLLSTEGHWIAVTPDSVTTLVRRNLALACGWLFAGLTFVISWVLAKRSLLMVALLVALASTSALLWQTWQIAIIGWLVLPAVAAALLEVSRRRMQPMAVNESDLSGAGTDSQSLGTTLDFSYSLRSMVILIVIFGCFASSLRAQDTRSEEDQSPVYVLVPVDADGRQVGDKVYLPSAIKDQLFNRGKKNEPAEVTILSALYRCKLDSSSRGPVEIEADFTVNVDGPTNQIRLPIATNKVVRLELRQGDETRILVRDRVRDELSFELPPGNTFDLRLTIRPTIDDVDGHRRLTFKIPPVSASRLLLEADRGISRLNVTSSLGQVVADSALRRWEANLGAVSGLVIDYVPVVQNQPARELIRRYWISVGKVTSTINCEVEPPEVAFVGDSVQLQILGEVAEVESLEATAPRVVSPNWRLTRQTFLSPTRRSITLTKIAESSEVDERGAKLPDYIHLLWATNTQISSDGAATRIPEVLPVDAAGLASAIIALQHDSQLDASLSAASLTAITPTDFKDRWRGFKTRTPIQQSFSVDQGFPSLTVAPAETSEAVCTQNVQLHIAKTDQIELRYRAVVSAGDPSAVRRTLWVPKSVDVRRIEKNGKPLVINAIPIRSINEYPLGEFSKDLPTSIEVFGRVKNRKALPPPELQFSPPLPTTVQYEVTRGPDVHVQVPNAKEQLAQAARTQIPPDRLAAAQIPVLVWQTGGDADPESPPAPKKLTITKKLRNFDCEQLVALSYDDARWGMQAIIRFEPNNVPDFVDVEVPRRWCDSLEITPATLPTRRPSTDPELEVIRIAPRQLVNNAIVIKGQLDDSDQVGISVPRVSVLGRGNRELYVSVPQRSTSQWKQSQLVGVRKNLPAALRGIVALNGQRKVFHLPAQDFNSTWSIDLLPTLDLKTQFVASDTQIFLRESEALVICRLDLVPGNVKSVAVRLPRDATCLGSWSAQRPVQFTTLKADTITSSSSVLDDDAANESSHELVRVPLSLSRLSQSVELLLSIPMRRARLDDYLPSFYAARNEVAESEAWTLTNVPVGQQWVAVYSPNESAPPENELAERFVPPPHMNSENSLDEARAIGLAAASIEAVEQSLEILADRPRGEVATWLIPWVGRYRRIAASAGRGFDWRTAVATVPDESSATRGQSSATEAVFALSAKESWQHLDQRMATHARRFLADDVQISEPLFAAGRFEGYKLTDANKIAPGSPPRPILSMSTGMQDLRDFISNVLTLVMVCGLLVLMWPVRHRIESILKHPASWLALLGVVALFVAPVPVAIAIIVVAITLPAFPLKERRHA